MIERIEECKSVCQIQEYITENPDAFNGNEIVTISFFSPNKPIKYCEMNIAGLFRS